MAESRPEAKEYGTLVDRAYACLRQAGGELDDTELVAQVFGAGRAGPLWLRLLSQMLAADERFRHLPNGCWALAPRSSVDSPLAGIEFVVLDLKAVGPKPWTHRILDIALILIGPGGELDSFATQVNPQQRLPQYVLSLTGLRPEDVAEAPLFERIADEIEDRLRQRLLVGHGLALQVAYLQYELRRLGRPALSNELLDTLELAHLLLPDLGKPSLENLAQRLGEPGAANHGAAADARLVARVARRLLKIASDRGYRSLRELREAIEKRAALSVFADATEAIRPRLLLDAHHEQDVPALPGVYAFRDRGGQVLYVGKASDLSRRLAAYVNRPLSYTRRMEGLVEAVDSVEVLPVDTELEALLLEARLIRQYRPPFNVQRHTHSASAFLRIDRAEPFPRLQACARLRPDGALYFGPFRSSRQLRQTVGLLQRLLPLRTCARALGRPRGRRQARPPCLKLSTGACCGPCAEAISTAEYAEYVEEAISLLRGDKDRTYERLRSQLREAIRQQDQEREQATRKLMRALQNWEGERLLLGSELPHPREPLYPVGGFLPGRKGGDVEDTAHGRPSAEERVGGSVLVLAAPAAREEAVVVFALGEGILLGQRRFSLPLEAEEVEGFLSEVAAAKEAGEEGSEGFNLAIRWAAQHAGEAALWERKGAEGAEGFVAAVDLLMKQAANRR